MRRGLLRAGLAASAPCVVLLVALPVGFVMELGKQVRVRIVNPGERPLRVTLLGTGRGESDLLRVASQSLHPLLPLPAFRAVDLPLDPRSSRTLFYSARQGVPRLLAVRDDSGALFERPLPAAARNDVDAGREIVLETSTPLAPAGAAARAALESHTQAYPWAVLLAAPLGTLAFLRFRRSLSHDTR